MMKSPTFDQRCQRLMLAVIICSVSLGTAAPAAAQMRRAQQEAFRAAVYVDGQPAPQATASVDIVITRWTTPEARSDLLAALMVKGEQQMRAHLSRQRPTGYVQLATGPRYELKYAWQEAQGGITRIVLISDRIVPFVTAWNATHTFRYRITSFELQVDDEGNGSGVAQVGVRVHVPPETRMLMVETLDAKPVELRDVSRIQ
jgi:hypothetical protein